MVELNGAFEIYARDFDKLIAMKQEQTKLTREVLDPLGLKSLTGLEELQAAAGKASNPGTMLLAGEAMKQLLLVRLNVNKLLGRHEQSAADAAEKALVALKKAMAALDTGIVGDEARKIFADVNGNVQKYADAYHKAAHDAHEVEALANGEMAKAAQTISAAAASIKESGIAEETKIEHETEQLIVSTESMILTIAIVSLVFGIALAWLIGRAIAKPVVGLCNGMRELAEGNFQVVLPGLGRGDEVGDMAQAVEMFKIKAEQKARDEAEAQDEAGSDRRAAAQGRDDQDGR